MYVDIQFLRITFANIQRNKKGNSPDAANLDKILRSKRVFTSIYESSITQRTACSIQRTTSFEEQARSSELIQITSSLHKCTSLFFYFFENWNTFLVFIITIWQSSVVELSRLILDPVGLIHLNSSIYMWSIPIPNTSRFIG